MSLRLIPAVPFSAINYAAGASAVRVLPYTVATLAGLLPGTAAVVILGDALAGHPSPLLFLVSLCTATLGVTGLVIEIRHYPAAPPPQGVAGRRTGCHAVIRDQRLYPVCAEQQPAGAAGADRPEKPVSSGSLQVPRQLR